MAPRDHERRTTESGRPDADTINNITQTVALILAGAWGVYTFIYQERIAPALAPPTLSVTSVLEKAGRHGDLMAIHCGVTRTNVGQSSVRILGLAYNVSGIKEHFLTGAGMNPGFENALGDAGVVNRARYQLEPERQEVILQNGTLFAGAHAGGSPSELNPEEAVTRNMVFYADRSRFDRVRLQVSLVYGRLDDSPTPLVLETNRQGQLEANLAPPCRDQKSDCPAVFTTDFSTELSLWE
jgi:hypothetical protein